METHTSDYIFTESLERLNEILDSADNEYSGRDSVPARSDLTYTNGFYAKCSVMFVDIRDSTFLVNSHTRPVLAKIYRAFISEVIAVMRSNSNIKEIYIEGDCVWGVFDTPKQTHINQVFQNAGKIASLIDVLNWRLEKKEYSAFKVGIGLSWGEALMIKAGAKNSGINEVVYMGSVVSEAAMLCSLGSRNYSNRIFVSNDFQHNLTEEHQKFLNQDPAHKCYSADVVNALIDNWLTVQKAS